MRLIVALLLLTPFAALADPVSLAYAAVVAIGSYGVGLSAYAVLFLTITTYNTVSAQRKAKRLAAQARASLPHRARGGLLGAGARPPGRGRAVPRAQRPAEAARTRTR